MKDTQHGFDEALISGYLDGELTQGEEQRVRIHLENCADCRNVSDDLRRLKEAAMTTEFQVPDDSHWDETPRGAISLWFRNFGWALAIAWFAGIIGFGIWQVVRDAENVGELLIVFGFWLALGLIFVSVLIDRLKTYKTDKYRRVQK